MRAVLYYVLRVGLLLALAAGSVVHAEEVLRLGITAFRPKPIMEQRYQPLADYLSAQIGRKVELLVLNQPEIEAAIDSNQLDLLLTNPAHYAIVRNRSIMANVLATVVSRDSGQDVASFGGVIISKAQRDDIQTLQDLQGQRIGVSGTLTYPSQALELVEAGVPLPQGDKLKVFENNDQVVAAVLDDRVDVGFVRTGILESLKAEGSLDPQQLKVINAQKLAGFPFLVSTRLYPEWPLIALPSAERQTLRQLSVALLGLNATHPAAQAAGIGGFVPPANYTSVDQLTRSLRMPPYDQVPEFTLSDVWQQYRWFIVAGGTTLAMIVALLVMLVRRQVKWLAASQELAAAYQQREMLAAHVPGALYQYRVRPDGTSHFTYASQGILGVHGVTPEQIRDDASPIFHTVHPDDVGRIRTSLDLSASHSSAWHEQYRVLLPDGRMLWVEGEATPQQQDDGSTIWHGYIRDITERKTAEEALAYREALFTALFEQATFLAGILDHENRLIEVNQPALRIIGQPSSAVLGQYFPDTPWWLEDQKPRLIEALAHAQAGHVHGFEAMHVNADGSPMNVEAMAIPVMVGNRRFVSITGLDITERKKAESSLALQMQRMQNNNLILSMVNRGEPLHEVLDTLARIVEQQQPGCLCSILLLDDDGQHLHHGAGPCLPEFYKRAIDGVKIGEGVGSCGTAAYRGSPVIAEDIRTHPFWADYRELALQAELVACWSYPLKDADERVQGTFALYHHEPAAPSHEQLALIEDCANLASLVITHHKAEEKLRRAAIVFTHAQEGIMIADEQQNIVEINQAFTSISGYQPAEVIGQNLRILRSDLQDADFYQQINTGLHSQGYWSGEVWSRHKSGQAFAVLVTVSVARDERGQIRNYILLFSDITQLKEQQAQLEHIAHYDALTNRPNRLMLATRLQQAMQHTRQCGNHLAVLYLDLDGFKVVNDTHGHEVGDQLLVTISRRMSQALREGDTLARIGGDEFVAVLVDLPDTESCSPILQRLLQAASEPLQIDELSLYVSASVGVSFYPQAEDIEADQLVRQADQAMYQAKQAGRNRFHFFDAEQDRHIRGYHESIEHIRVALAKQQFVLFYQPKVNMQTGELLGAEALIRWQHPERGLVAPAAFLPVIENHPLALELGAWVVETALSQIEAWRALGLRIPVSVNVGALELQHPEFIPRLRASLTRHPGVQHGDLELEVLETSALKDFAQVSEVMRECQGMGVGFAVDDFGTGYSSLAYLKQLPYAMLKIDQTFVRGMLDDPDDLAILQSVLWLAVAFQRKVIAEGVETLAHGELLLQLGCTWGQGYAIARPMPAHQLPDWAATWQPCPQWQACRPVNYERLPPLITARLENSGSSEQR